MELCKAVRLPILELLFICFLFSPGYFHHLRYAHISNDCNFVIFLVVIVQVSHPYKSVDHTLWFYNSFSCSHTDVSSSYSFQHLIECTSCNFNSFQDFIITFSIWCYSLSQIVTGYINTFIPTVRYFLSTTAKLLIIRATHKQLFNIMKAMYSGDTIARAL